MKIRSKLLCLSAAVLLLVAALAAALMHHAYRGQQLRALANLASARSDAYTQLRTSPLLLLDGASPAPQPPGLGARLAQLRGRVDGALAALERAREEEGQWEGTQTGHIAAVREACERWLREDVGALARLPPDTRAAQEHWVQAAASFAQRVAPRIAEAELRERQERAQTTELNARVVSLSRTLATVGPVLALGALLALLLGVVLPMTRGLRMLLAGSRRLGTGRLDTEVDVRGEDELAELGRAFNRMARELRESVAAQERAKEAQAQAAARELQHEGALLEEQVRARTAELEATNQQLSDSLRQLRDTQAQLLFADRLASVGLLAAGVAHEVNNPLSFVLGNVRFARDTLGARPALPERERAEVLEALDEAFIGADRVRLIVQDLKTFSRPPDGAGGGERPVDLREVLRVAVKMAGSELRHRARVVEAYGEAPRVQGSEARLGQVFLNLLINAAQAITPGHPERNAVYIRLEADAGGARVEIADSGAGIAPEDLARIFDPFFTTKPVGAGTGLGLSVCHGIVSALGGRIRVQSEPGRGTTFQVFLPAAADAASPEPRVAAAPQPALPARVHRLLVVDDEPAIGALVRRTLGARAEVTYACSGAEALAQLAAPPAFDAVLCDVMMPGMTGIELHGRVAREGRGGERAFVFMTGGALTPEVQRFLDAVANPTLLKPFSSEQLLALLAGREPPPPARS